MSLPFHIARVLLADQFLLGPKGGPKTAQTCAGRKSLARGGVRNVDRQLAQATRQPPRLPRPIHVFDFWTSVQTLQLAVSRPKRDTTARRSLPEDQAKSGFRGTP